MTDIARQAIKAAGISNAFEYRKHLSRLSLCYFVMFGASLAGAFTLYWKGKLFVTLSQRSNVETLTIAFFVVFFLYLAALSAKGAWGTLKILRFKLMSFFVSKLEVEKRKMRALGEPGKNPAPGVALNLAFVKEDQPYEALIFEIRDQAGSMGRLRLEGARIKHEQAHRGGFNSLFVYFVERLQKRLQNKGIDRKISIVEWEKLNGEEAAKYLSQVDFARKLSQELKLTSLWPTVALNSEDCRVLEEDLSQLCPTLRYEGFLPDWEFSGEHKLPIIPEPLGLVSLSRSEKRVDPLSSMFAALIVVLLTLAISLWIVVRPPWVPGT
jgi:hypothetical protein